jgi:hypothetical protein
MNRKVWLTLALILGIASLLETVQAGLPDKKPVSDGRQIVVLVHKADKRIEWGDKELVYEMDSKRYAKSGINLALAELHLNRDKNTAITALIDDTAPLEAIAEFGEMAINAGFTDVHIFVCFHKTDRMAEVQLGPALKFSQNPVVGGR